jgi:hypothetical protein
MSSVSSMLPMLLVIGLAVVAFIKRCEFLPELCNPSAAALPPPTLTTATQYLPGPTWEDYVNAGKRKTKDDNLAKETLEAAKKIAERTGRPTPIDAPKPGAKFARVSYF